MSFTVLHTTGLNLSEKILCLIRSRTIFLVLIELPGHPQLVLHLLPDAEHEYAQENAGKLRSK
jgi:hypothetical protein